MNSETFEKELTMCRSLNEKNGGKCHWGECVTCGVIPLLYKLHKGEFLETPEQIAQAKNNVFGNGWAADSQG